MVKRMAFMQRQITKKREWWEVDGTCGTEFFDKEDFTEDEARENYSGEVWTVESRTGHGARLSAPGYMDCTEWSVFDTVAEAQAYLDEYYPEDEEDETEEDANGN
jgi:hypothetical protein